MTFGHLVGEVIRRVTGKSVGQFLRAEVTGPLGADFFIGVPEEEVAGQAFTHHQLLQDYRRPLGDGNNMFISVSAPGDGESAPPGHRVFLRTMKRTLLPTLRMQMPAPRPGLQWSRVIQFTA